MLIQMQPDEKTESSDILVELITEGKSELFYMSQENFC